MEQNELLIAIIAGLGGMLGWGFADFFAKKTVDQIGPIVSLVWAHLFGTAFLLGLVFVKMAMGEQIGLPTNIETWGLLVFFGALQAIVYLVAYHGFGKGQLAILNPIFASYSGVAALLSIVIFGEVLTPFLLLSLVIIFAGVLLLNIDTQALKFKKIGLLNTPGVKEMIIAALLAASWTILWDRAVNGQDWLSFAFFMYLFMTITALLIAKFQKVNLKVTKPNLWKFLVLIGISEVIAYLAISLGFGTTQYTSLVAVLSGAFSLPTIVLARFFLKEKVTQVQTIGSLVIVMGIILLSLM